LKPSKIYAHINIIPISHAREDAAKFMSREFFIPVFTSTKATASVDLTADTHIELRDKLFSQNQL
jgi:hypothetical protein